MKKEGKQGRGSWHRCSPISAGSQLKTFKPLFIFGFLCDSGFFLSVCFGLYGVWEDFFLLELLYMIFFRIPEQFSKLLFIGCNTAVQRKISASFKKRWLCQNTEQFAFLEMILTFSPQFPPLTHLQSKFPWTQKKFLAGLLTNPSSTLPKNNNKLQNPPVSVKCQSCYHLSCAHKQGMSLCHSFPLYMNREYTNINFTIAKHPLNFKAAKDQMWQFCVCV